MSPASKSHPQHHWELWIDTGGTFTDCIARDPEGNTRRLKVLSNSVIRGKITGKPGTRYLNVDLAWPVDEDVFAGYNLRVVGTKFQTQVEAVDLSNGRITVSSPVKGVSAGSFIELSTGEEVPLLAARLLTKTRLGSPFPFLEMKLGSTRGTNAILEHKGAATALLVTSGFKDLLVIGNQQRPDLFALNIQRPEPLYQYVSEIDERVAADGTVLKALTEQSLEELVSRLKRKKIQSVAIALLNAYVNPVHEQVLSLLLRKNGFEYVSTSHELSTQIRLLPRAETTLANAYLDPIIHAYVSGIQAGLLGAPLYIMTSSGSLVRASSFYPKDSLLSGPAGGVVGAAKQAARSGLRKILAFDMGGTSTDVSMYNNRFDYRFESRVGAHSILSPSLAIETIAAGGGSICDFDGYRLQVGPRSASANPGPACYGAGGPLTITDVNLLLGRLDPRQFAIPLKPEASAIVLDALVRKMNRIGRKKLKPTQVLESLLQIANEKMAEAIRKISVEQGHNPRDFTLLSFGGAGGQHACALADILGMASLLVPYEAGLLSAYGIGHASVERFEEKLLLQPLSNVISGIDKVLEELYQHARGKLLSEGYTIDRIRKRSNLLFLRFVGQDSPIEIEYHAGDSIPQLFRTKYEAIYGHWTERVIEVESIRVIAEVFGQPVDPQRKKSRAHKPDPARYQKAHVNSKQVKMGVYRWEDLARGARISGPALIVSGNSTTFASAGWEFRIDDAGNGHLKKVKARSTAALQHSQAGELELFTNRFTAVAQEMGALLQRASFSVNIKERLDFSCALLDAGGSLVVNAPHIPVHLGSMGVCVREVRKAIQMEEGDVVITNHPAYGGSHLPDITLIKPVFYMHKLVGYVANRAHHAEIGGSKPGSMPADARELVQEGVVIAPMHLVRRNKPLWDDITRILSSAPFPTRSLGENLADLNGALASVHLGGQGLIELCRTYGAEKVTTQMKVLRSYATSLLSESIDKIGRKPLRATEFLDDESPLRVSIKRQGRRLSIDFTGSSPVHPGNLNATKAIVQSVVLYCLRLLVGRPLPMNEGLMELVDLVLPPGLLNPDFTLKPCPAVVGGNTEVSQRLTDTILKALGLAACSQGTMNNFLFGNKRFGYYETICGGTGAGPDFDGTSGVHQHMTNTRITDPEVLEFRYPVRLRRFELRRHSGGNGRWVGGDGVTREVEFLEALEMSLLTQHRKERPYGSLGGEGGKPGMNLLVRRDGTQERLPGIVSVSVEPGDRLVIETPGGGGWGKAKRKGPP